MKSKYGDPDRIDYNCLAPEKILNLIEDGVTIPGTIITRLVHTNRLSFDVISSAYRTREEINNLKSIDEAINVEKIGFKFENPKDSVNYSKIGILELRLKQKGDFVIDLVMSGKLELSDDYVKNCRARIPQYFSVADLNTAIALAKK
jgi:hypothetical protein